MEIKKPDIGYGYFMPKGFDTDSITGRKIQEFLLPWFTANVEPINQLLRDGFVQQHEEIEKLKKENDILRKWMCEIEEHGCEIGGNNFHFEMVQQCWNELRQLDKDKG